MKRHMDKIDYHMLSLLKQNARQPLAKLAKQIGLSRTAAQERLQRLERDHVITGYTIRQGQNPYIPLIQAVALLRVHPKFNLPVVLQLEKLPEITLCQAVNGRFDILINIQTPSLEDMDALLDEIGTIDGIEETHSHIILATKFQKN